MNGKVTLLTLVIPDASRCDERCEQLVRILDGMTAVPVDRVEANRRRKANEAAMEVQYSNLHGGLVAHDGRPADSLRGTVILFDEVMAGFAGCTIFGIKKTEKDRNLTKVEVRLGVPQESTPEIPSDQLQALLACMIGWCVSVRQVWENPKPWGMALNLVVSARPVESAVPQCRIEQVNGEPFLITRKRVRKDVAGKIEFPDAEA